MSNQNNISDLTSEDLEMLLLGTVAFWGDGSLSKKELDLLNQRCRKRINKLEIVSLSDSSDIDLSSKEYIVALFKMIEKVSSDTEIYQDAKLHQDFMKKKGKDYEPDNQIKFFSMLTDELNSSYVDDCGKKAAEKVIKKKVESRFTELRNEIKKMATIDKITDREQEMLSLLDIYAGGSGIGCFGYGCLSFIIISLIAALVGFIEHIISYDGV